MSNPDGTVTENVTNNDGASNEAPQTDAPNTDAPQAEAPTNEEVIPKATFDQAYARAKKAEEKLKEFEESNRKAEESKLLEDKKYEELLANKNTEIESLIAKTSQIEVYESKVNGIVDDYLSRIPEERASLIPESLGVIEKLDYITKNQDFLMGDSGSKKIGSSTPKNTSEPVLNETEADQARFDELMKLASETGGRLGYKEKEELNTLTKKLKQAKA